MPGASLSIPYKGILAILCIIMKLGLADATIGYDCYSELANITMIHLENQDHETREMLKRNMKFCSVYPDECAFELMGGPGYMTLMEGDKLYIEQCEPVEVELKNQNTCYDRLAFLRGNQRLFLIPWTRIITKTATELPCDSPLLQNFEFESTVYKVVARPEGSSSLSRLKPLTESMRKHKEIPNLVISLIYTAHQMHDWQLHQQHPNMINLQPVSQVFPDTNGDTPGVIHPHRDDSNSRWYETWNIISLISVGVCSILVATLIKFISKRQRRQQIQSDNHDFTIKSNQFQNV